MNKSVKYKRLREYQNNLLFKDSNIFMCYYLNTFLKMLVTEQKDIKLSKNNNHRVKISRLILSKI